MHSTREIMMLLVYHTLPNKNLLDYQNNPLKFFELLSVCEGTIEVFLLLMNHKVNKIYLCRQPIAA